MTRKRAFPDTYLIIFIIILICAIATWVVPGGRYVTAENGSVSFVPVDSVPQTWQVFTAFIKGFSKQASIIIFVLAVGGTFWILNKSRAVEVGIRSFIKRTSRLEKHRWLGFIGVNNIIMVLIMTVFSLFGAVYGMSEETIAFVGLMVPLAISMGYDSITGVCLVYVAAHVGFSGAFLNPFSVGIAQSLADIPLFSGIEYRLVCWLILNIFLTVFVLSYAGKVKKNPQFSPVYQSDSHWRTQMNPEGEEGVNYYHNKASLVVCAFCLIAILLFTVRYSSSLCISLGNKSLTAPWLLWLVAGLFAASSVACLRKSVHFFILNLLFFSMLYLIIGVLAFGWYLEEIFALFLALGIAGGIACGMSGNALVREFIAGMKDIMSAALVIGLASGIIIILQDGFVMDSILHSLEQSLGENSSYASLSLMYGILTAINCFIPSASAKAAITMPVIAPFADIIGLSRQATVLAFQFGDGFTNMITPTSGVLIAALAMARVQYSVWFKFIWKFILVLIVLGFVLLLPTVLMELPGF